MANEQDGPPVLVLKRFGERSALVELTHDGFAKANLTKVEVARSLCEAHIPEEYRKKLGMKLSKLSIVGTEYQTRYFKTKIADVIYRIPTKTGDSFVMVHIEHQSTAQRHMSLRMLETMLALMRREIGDDHNSKQDLPLVIPIVLYAGEKPYNQPTSLVECFKEEQREVAEALLKHPFRLVDLTQIPDEELRRHAHASVMELLLKRVQEDDSAYFLIKTAVQLLKELLDSGLVTLDGANRRLVEVIQYLCGRSTKTPLSDVEVREMFESLESDVEGPLGETLMSIRDQLINMGHDQAAHHIAINFLKEGISAEKVARASELSLAEVLRLQEELIKKH